MPKLSSLNRSAAAPFWGSKESWVLVFIIVITFLSMLPCLFNGFVNLDDPFHVIGNKDIRSLDWEHLKIMATTTLRGYIPLTFLSFAVEYHFFGLNPFVFHLDNVLLHVIVTGLIFTFALRMGLGIWAAGFGGLLFGIHPMHVESVAWVTERKDVLYAVFYMFALHSYWSYLETQRKRSFVFSIVWGILSMLAKPMALSLPLIFLLCDWMKGRKMNLKVLLEKLPHFFYVVPIALITFLEHVPSYHHASGGQVLVGIWCAVFYVWKFFFPVVLVPYYIRPEDVTLLNPAYLAAVIFFVLCVVIWIRFRNNRWLTFAWLFYFLSIFFLFQFSTVKVNVVFDRFMYLPSVGFCFLTGYLFDQGRFWLKGKGGFLKSLALIGVIALFVGLLVKTIFQCRIWKDSVTMWSASLRNNSKSPTLLYQMGKAYEYMGKLDLAKAQYDKLLFIDPAYDKAYANRGTIFLQQGLQEEAFLDFNKSAELNPRSALVFYNRALIYIHRNQNELALADLNKALELQPKFMNAYAKRGLIYLSMKQYDLAIENCNQGLRINPSALKLYFYRSQAYANLNRMDEALEDALKAQALGYPNLDSYINQLKQHASSK